MVKSKQSMTGSRRGNTYPDSMNGLLDSEGHVSLNESDYVGYSQEDIEAFLSSREYEVTANFAPDGTLILIQSQFNRSNVTCSVFTLEYALKYAQKASGIERGYTDFHNHPIDRDGVVEIWSPGDISEYVRQSAYYNIPSGQVMYGACDNYKVRTSLGHEFSLQFDPSIRSPFKKSADFEFAYEDRINDVVADTKSAIKAGKISTREGSDIITSRMDAWLKLNAADYGYRYKTNYRMGG